MNKKRIIIGALVLITIITALVWTAQRFGFGKEEKAAEKKRIDYYHGLDLLAAREEK